MDLERNIKNVVDKMMEEGMEEKLEFYFYGDIVPQGTYRCVLCGIELVLEEGEELDLCPVCSGSKYQKVK